MSPVYKLSANSVKNGRTVYGSMLAGNTAYTPPSWYDSLATVTVGSGGSSEIVFSSLPTDYTHLQIRFIGRSAISSDYAQNIAIRFNSDTGSNYSRHYLLAYTGGYAANASGGDTSQSKMSMSSGLSSSAWTSQIQGAGIIDILDYRNTNKYKTVRMLAGAEANSETRVSTLGLSSGLWMSTSAITSINIQDNNPSGSFEQYSHFALYGIKGA